MPLVVHWLYRLTCWGTWYKRWKGCLELRTRKTSPSVSQLKRLDTTDTGNWNGRELSAVHVLQSKQHEGNLHVQTAVWCCMLVLSACAKLEKQSMPTEVNITTVITELVFYSSISWLIVGGWKASWKNRDLLERPLYVYFSFSSLRKKKIWTPAWGHLWIICEYCNNFKIVRNIIFYKWAF